MFVNKKGLMWGSGGVAPSRRRHRGSGVEPPALDDFFDFLMKITYF